MSKEIGNFWECNKEIEVNICCNQYDCGCQGLPTEPPFCSNECYEKWMSERV